jgi:sulfoxide reductase heme-binding subunit YedZ
MSFAKVVVLVNGLVPLALIIWDAIAGRLGANPVEFLLRSTGFLALTFLTLTLTVTPARKLLNRPALGKHRRMLGLFSFFYATIHVCLYLWLDHFFDVRAIATDILTRPFQLFGALAYGFMVPLAATSTQAAIRRMGKRWTALHKRVYWVAAFAVVHFWMGVKADTSRPALFAVLIGVLLFWRYVNRTPKPGLLKPQ